MARNNDCGVWAITSWRIGSFSPLIKQSNKAVSVNPSMGWQGAQNKYSNQQRSWSARV
ncbi:exodeoxyribonuclease V subunit beta [Sesbania bispinosa]|nr:exodeoxyribonuclease V subunit beta [Sesbania bispinosa]